METRFILLWLSGILVLIFSLVTAFLNKLRGRSAKVPLRNAAISFVASFVAFVGFGYTLDNSSTQASYEDESPSRGFEEVTTEAVDSDSALSVAESYLSSIPMSKQELYDQLLYEGYSEEEAQSAVDAIDTDWNEQALLAAKNQLEYDGISKSGLETTMGYAGFTPEEIRYAMENIEPIDWNEEALQSAQSYLEYSSLTGQDLYDQLIYEGFAEDQAAYAMENLSE